MIDEREISKKGYKQFKSTICRACWKIKINSDKYRQERQKGKFMIKEMGEFEVCFS
jgi:hypothetical protein